MSEADPNSYSKRITIGLAPQCRMRYEKKLDGLTLFFEEGQAVRAPFSALGMVKSVEISNFRGFGQFEVRGLELINFVVGDNAVGKTTLLEAIFLALSASPDKGLSLKQWRGMDIAFQHGSGESVFEGIYADLFHDPKSLDPISIKLCGHGFENRELHITHIAGEITIPTKDVEPPDNRKDKRAAKSQKRRIQTLEFGKTITAPILLTWMDENGEKYEGRVLLTPNGLRFEGTGEKIPNSFLFAAQVPISSVETATNFSTLRKTRSAGPFRRAFLNTFTEIRDISVETVGNSSTLVADVPWAKQLLPLPALSGGSNRVAGILLALAYRPHGVVLVDEIESGVYHTRFERFAKGLIEMAREYRSQLIMTTHSEEWLVHAVNAAREQNQDIAFWRMERIDKTQISIRKFSLSEFSEGLAAGEMR